MTIVVLPTPGPPVMTSTLDMRASRIAAIWLSARTRPIRFSTDGRLCPDQSRATTVSHVPAALGARRLCVPPDRDQPEIRKAFRQPGRQLRCPPVVRARRQSGLVVAALRATSRPAAPAGPSATRNDPRPLPRSVHRKCPARTRIMAVFSMPSFAAIASAVLKPMPRISRASRYGFSDMTWMASEP